MMTTLVEKLRNLLITRQQAYQQTFNLESLAVQKVLLDLAKFCRANASTFHQDPRAHALLEGRREAYLRIMKHINLDTEEFIKQYGKGLE